MKNTLLEQFNVMQNKRQRTLEALKVFPASQLETSTNAEWSVAQVFFHLNTAEKLSTLYVKKKMQGGTSLPTPGIMQSIKLWYAGRRFKAGIKFKAPKILGCVPPHVSYVQILSEWDQTRQELKNLLETFPPTLLSKSVFKQPAIGYLTLAQMLVFMNMHANKHFRQILSSLSQ